MRRADRCWPRESMRMRQKESTRRAIDGPHWRSALSRHSTHRCAFFLLGRDAVGIIITLYSILPPKVSTMRRSHVYISAKLKGAFNTLGYKRIQPLGLIPKYVYPKSFIHHCLWLWQNNSPYFPLCCSIISEWYECTLLWPSVRQLGDCVGLIRVGLDHRGLNHT